jgi:hypothetical protein
VQDSAHSPRVPRTSPCGPGTDSQLSEGWCDLCINKSLTLSRVWWRCGRLAPGKCVARNVGQCLENPSVRLKNEDGMDEKYSWQVAYQAAILETEDAAMSLRIYEALAAIEQRRLSDLEPGSEEDRSLEDAERGLLALKAERIDPSGTQ